MQVKGNELNATARAEALSQFVHRYTGDHTPSWALKPMPDGSTYPLQFANDEEWRANTVFEVTKSGRLSRRDKYCYSTPTWPNNPELRKTTECWS